MKMGFITFCLFFLATSHYVLCYKREKIDIIEYKIIEEENCTFGSDCSHGPCINGKCRQGESCQPSTHHQIDTGECCSDQDCNESFYYSSMPKICYVNMTGYSYCLLKGQFLTFLRTKDLTARLATIDGICETSEQCPAKSICKDLDYIKRCECLPAFPRFNKMYNICQRQTQPPQSDGKFVP